MPKPGSATLPLLFPECQVIRTALVALKILALELLRMLQVVRE